MRTIVFFGIMAFSSLCTEPEQGQIEEACQVAELEMRYEDIC